MKATVALLTLLLAVTTAASALACEPVNQYDWAIPTEAGCVGFAAPQAQPGSPTLEITNNCASPVTVTPVDCTECDIEAVVQPGETASYVVNASVGSNEDVMFTIGWRADDGAKGTVSGVVSRLEGAEDPCDDSAMCATSPTREPGSVGWALGLLAVVAGLRRRLARNGLRA